MKRKYCLDTNIFINGWTKHYRIDVFPSVWEKLDELLTSGIAFSCREVYEELKEQRDPLFDWARQRKSSFEQPTEEITFEMKFLMQEYPNLAAQGGPRNRADPWVICHARQANAIVVTDEQFAERTKPTKPPKIPNICTDLNVAWMGPVDFFAVHKLRL